MREGGAGFSAFWVEVRVGVGIAAGEWIVSRRNVLGELFWRLDLHDEASLNVGPAVPTFCGVCAWFEMKVNVCVMEEDNWQ